ncbi:helix-turn-helix domain-containing protein [Pseudomonas fluorescens]|uniref:IclR family transcriptional regulator n=1 Tax=Pseudomonas fluorescens TaxID=294 RepID=UPI002ACAE3E5|nr:helix-turn-helix domain-containing protein [Pseudomonas fluorescens]MDZ5431926.1 helix-turn-helix domain-containing protein [Pseudomonas fluorescens]
MTSPPIPSLEKSFPGHDRRHDEMLAERPLPRSGIVVPLMRALEVLSAFTANDPWLGNQDICNRTGLPAPTTTRFLKTLTALGYLNYSPQQRKYQLAAAVLSLGYAATAHSDIQRQVRNELVRFANANNISVVLGMRDRLDLVVLDNCPWDGGRRHNSLSVGSRSGLVSTQLGFTLLAALPSLERTYLLENIERRMPDDWPGVEPQLSDAIQQLRAQGFYRTQSLLEPDLSIVSVPLNFPDRAPFVLACFGSQVSMSKTRVSRELGPKLASLANHLKQSIE